MRADPARPTGDLANRDWSQQARRTGAPSVLLATDRSDWCDGAVDALEAGGFVVRAEPIAGTGPSSGLGVDLAVVDLAPPHHDGVALVRLLRAHHSMPILAVIPPLAGESALLEAFAAGADGCLTRPQRFRELVTRSRTLLRQAARGAVASPGPIELQVGPIRLDPEAHQVMVGGTAIDLTPMEALALRALLARPGRVVSRRELASAGPEPLGRAGVDALVRRLRTKLDAAEGRRRLVTVRGVGFRLLTHDDAGPSPDQALVGPSDEPIRAPACGPG